MENSKVRTTDNSQFLTSPLDSEEELERYKKCQEEACTQKAHINQQLNPTSSQHQNETKPQSLSEFCQDLDGGKQKRRQESFT
jgi:hypothetical protein